MNSPDELGDVALRRTFAIISHPDAGKTTLTEQFLHYGGAIQLAGTVRARKSGRYVTSDWMKLEKERGISVTSSGLSDEFIGWILRQMAYAHPRTKPKRLVSKVIEGRIGPRR